VSQLDGCATGNDVGSVRQLYVAHARDLHAYASRRVGREEAADVVAETFRIAIEAGDRFDPGLGSKRAWLFGIATNVMRTHHRTERRRLAALARQGAPETVAIDPLLVAGPRVDAERELSQVLEAVAALDIADYELLVLVAWERMPLSEVGEVLGIPAGTARSRLHRIRRTLEQASADDREPVRSER
jgi:RNA polymerase sigma-70 factor (ECF subfamily)